MKKRTITVIMILHLSLAALAQKSTPRTDITVPSDTARVQLPEKKPDARDPRLQLPDVLILGKDQYHRTVKNKKELTPESPTLIRQQAAYEAMSTWFKRQDDKPTLAGMDSLSIRQTWLKLQGGSFLTFAGDAGYWQRLKQGDAAAYAWFDRSEGQFHNSKYGEGGLVGKFKYAAAPNAMAIFHGEYIRYGRGLHTAGFGVDNAARQGGAGLFAADLQYDVNKLSDGNLGVEFGGIAMTSDTSGARIDKSDDFYYDIHFDYTTQYKKTQLKGKGQYIRETLETLSDSSRIQSGFGAIGFEIQQPLSSYFSAAIGVDAQLFSRDSTATKSRLSPYGRLNFIPSAHVGLSLEVTTGFKSSTFREFWQDNPYIAHRLPQQPVDENFAFRLRGDIEITKHIKFRGGFGRQWMRQLFYWQSDTQTGLFRLDPVADTKLSEIELGLVAEINEKTRLQASFIDYSDRIPAAADSASSDANLNRVPYRPDFRIPIRASIQLLPQMNLTLAADVVGARKKNISTDDTLPTYALFHADLSYEVLKNLSALLSVRNLLDAKYAVWDGYPETGIILLGGIRTRF
ncbi:TonB-dependent receptor [candidate division KSB1 bacterium]|nr:TonB-dependent receptor [candidate division KSB1 bacterium]